MDRRHFKSAALGLIVALVAACAGPQADKSTSAAELATKAVVVVSVTHDSDAGGRVDVGFVVDQGMSDARVLRSVERVMSIPKGADFEDRYGYVYTLLMPPGRHEISNWRLNRDTGHGMRPKDAPQPLVFEVKAGEVVYLGNLHMNFETAGGVLPGTWVTRGGGAEVRDRREVDMPIAEQKNPTLQGKWTARVLPVGPWPLNAQGLEHSQTPMVVRPLPAK